MALSDLIPDPNAPTVPFTSLMPGMSQPSSTPQLSSPGLKDLTPRQQQEQGLQNRISSYENPQKPQGFWQNVRHIAATIGNVAGDIVAPSTLALIPGTQLNRGIQHGQNVRELAGLQGQDTAEATAASENALRGAQTAGMQQEQAQEPETAAAGIAFKQAQAEALIHPQPKSDFELWHQQNPNGTAEDFQKLQSKPLSQDEADKRNAVWDTVADKYHLPKGQFSAGMSTADATALATAMNQVVGRDQGGAKITIQQQVANNAGQRTRDANTEKEYMAASKDLGGQFAKATAQSQALDQAIQEVNSGAMGQAVGTVKSLVGLAGGQGSGVRVTQAELNAITNARGIKGSFEGFISGLEGKGKMAPEQVAQLNQLLGDVQAKIQEKMQLQDKYLDQLSKANDTGSIRDIQSAYRKEFSGSGTPSQSGGGAQTFTDGGRQYNIPADQVAEFKKDHPNAR
jgi:hypothetical protein